MAAVRNSLRFFNRSMSATWKRCVSIFHFLEPRHTKPPDRSWKAQCWRLLLFALGRKTLASLCTAASQNLAAIFRCHACPEAVAALTHQTARLKSPFHGLIPLSRPLFLIFSNPIRSGKKERLERDAFREPDTLASAYTEMRVLSQS